MKATAGTFLAALALVVTACSGGGEPSTASTASTTVVTTSVASNAATATSIPATTAAPTSAPAIAPTSTTTAAPATPALPAHPDASAAAPSVIAIAVAGADESVALPPKGSLSRDVGIGSGVIVDPSGLAVTTASVVAGASEVTVRVDGRSKPVNAAVVGTADCSDVALIDLEGDGYTPANWATSATAKGDRVAVAGRNRGGKFDPADGELTGIGVERRADAFVAERVVEFTAKAAPAGAPLLNDDLEVIGVVLSGSRDNQRRALSAGVAHDLVVQLRSEEPPTSVGVVGQIISMRDPAVTGMWATSVADDSPVAGIGLQAGDVVMSIDGEQVVGGGLQRYCNLMRRAQDDNRVEFQVYRPLSDQILNGTLAIGGDAEARELTPLGLGAAIGSNPPADRSNTTGEDDRVSDDSGTISMAPSATWADADGGTWLDTGNPSLQVSPDLDRFGSHWGNPGLVVTTDTDAWERLGGNIGAYLVEQMGIFDEELCSSEDPVEAENDHYVGAYVLRSCPDGTTLLQGAYATTDGGGTMVYVEATYLDANDRAMLADVLTTVITE